MEVRCPECGQVNRVPDLAVGKKAICGKCKAELPVEAGDRHPVELTDANFATETSRGPMVVDFWAEWCGPCRMIGPVIEQLAAERTDVRFGKLNVDQFPRLAGQYNARSIPLLVFMKDGKERGRVLGAVPRTQIEAAIRQYLG